MAKKLFEGMSFDALCKKYLKEGADIAALSEEGAAPEMESEVDEFDAEMDAPVDEFGDEETVESEGDVTITLSADLVAALRSILALVDSEDSVDEIEDADDFEAEDDVTPADDMQIEEDGMESETSEEEGVFEEDEETILGDGQGATAAVVSPTTSAPARKKGTPAVDRKGTGEGDFSKVTSREGEAASTLGAPERKKGTPAVDRKATVAAAKAKPGKKILDIQR